MCPKTLNHVRRIQNGLFPNRRNFRLGCVEVGSVALKSMECQREAPNDKSKRREDLCIKNIKIVPSPEVGSVALKRMECQREAPNDKSVGVPCCSCLSCVFQDIKTCKTNIKRLIFPIGGTFVWVVWRWEVLPSRGWNANGKHQMTNL